MVGGRTKRRSAGLQFQNSISLFKTKTLVKFISFKIYSQFKTRDGEG